MSTTLALAVPYCLVASAMSVFYGLCACEIFSVSTQNRGRSWHIHQFWLNFLGSAVGWVAAWAILQATLDCASSQCSLSLAPSAVALFFLAFVGVTGYLPATVVGALGGVSKLVDALLSLIGGKQ